jgi:toxin ParE1/3/4
MPRILRTEQSRLDFLEIWEFIAADNLAEANKLIDLFDTKLAILAVSPHLGRERSELAPNLRSLPIGNYLIFYRPLTDGIQLIRVLHGARDTQTDSF